MNAADENLAIVVPTYNEAENVGILLEKIYAAAPRAAVVVVDDDSPDGTAEKVGALRRQYPALHCLVRKEKKGRGYATAAGLRYALELGKDYIMEMDADLSHDPAHIPEFLDAIRDVDFVIGSRFIKGGSDIERTVFRRGLSVLANAYFRACFGVSVRDCTSGYRCVRREVLEKVTPETLCSAGPPVLEEMLFYCRGFRMKEIPIRFAARCAGSSKLDIKTLAQCLALPWSMTFRRLSVMIR